MKRLLSFLFVFCAFSAFGAAGDYYGAQIDPQGWQLWLQFNQMNTNGTFALGLGANNSLNGNQKVTLTLTSQGYNDSGSLISVTRTIYGTKQIRFAYPNNTLPDVDSNTVPNITMIKIALSDFVYSTESNITVTVGAGLYSTNSVSSAAATAMPVTNNSLMLHPACIANWSSLGWQRITNTTMRLSAVGYHRSGQLGRPLRMMQFVARDTHSHAVTNRVTAMSTTKESVTGLFVSEYVTDLNLSGASFTQGDLIRCDFSAYPWVGDTGSILDTMDNVYTWPTPRYCSITNLYDNNLAYAGNYGAQAIVATNGSDSTGVAFTNILDITGPSNMFLTINGALLAIKGTNNAKFGHNDLGGGTVYLTQGKYAWTGGSGSYSTKPSTWVTIKNYPTNIAADVEISSQSGNAIACSRDHVQGISITATSGGGCFSGDDGLWLDGCTINSASGVPFYQNPTWYLTGCTIQYLNTGIRPFSTVNAAPSIVRGCYVTNNIGNWLAFTLLGNQFDVGASLGLTEFINNSTTPRPAPMIISCNNFAKANQTAVNIVQVFNAISPTNGLAFVQNIVENIKATTSGGPMVAFGGDGNVQSTTNVLVWNNVLLGHKYNAGYNDTTTNWHVLWSIKNNVMDNCNIKTDTFSPTSNGRTQNWACVFGVGWSGNYFLETTNVGAYALFSHESTGANGNGGFSGLNTYQPVLQLASSPTNYARFVLNGAFGGTNGLGGGNYRLLSPSPLVTNTTSTVIPYDIEGVPRGGFDPPGAYASASPRKGAGFFQ